MRLMIVSGGRNGLAEQAFAGCQLRLHPRNRCSPALLRISVGRVCVSGRFPIVRLQTNSAGVHHEQENERSYEQLWQAPRGACIG